MSSDEYVLPPAPTLLDCQTYVAQMEVHRGFDSQTSIDKCLLLGEEVGELFKAVRTCEGLKIDVPGGDVGAELADVLIYLCAIANRYGLDLESEFRAKEEVNRTRVWR